MRTQLLSDKELIKRYQKGEEAALQMLINRHKRKLFTHIYLIVKDRELAEDIFQDTFFKVINTLRLGKYTEEGKFLPWLMRIGHNLAVDYFRKSKKIPISEGGKDFDLFDIIKETDDNVEDSIVRDEISADLRELVDLLPDKQREVLVMRHFCDLSFKEIAEETNVSINTALGRMRYALINMRRMITDKKLTLTNA